MMQDAEVDLQTNHNHSYEEVKSTNYKRLRASHLMILVLFLKECGLEPVMKSHLQIDSKK